MTLVMKTQEVTISGRKTINIVMEDAFPMLKEAIVIGYGTTSVMNTTDAISRVDTKIINENSASTVMEILQGQIPGMITFMGSGAPGEEALTVIRGVSSIEGNLGPLIVVDDIPMDENFMLNNMNPNDIYSIDVLKGASAMAIYGSRGSGGVLMVTTKNGLNTLPSITYRMNYGVVTLTSPMELLNSDEFKSLWIESVVNRASDENYVGTGSLYTDITSYSTYYKNYIDKGYWGESETNWMDILYQPAVKKNHNLTVNGNAAGLGYSIGLGLTDEVGQIIGSGYKRYNVNVKLDSRQNKLVTFGINVIGTSQSREESAVSLSSSLLMRPDLPAYNSDGSVFVPPTTTGYRNPLVDLEGTDKNTNNLTYTVAGYIQFNLMKGLTWKTLASINNSDNNSNQYYGSQTAIGSNNWSTVSPRFGRLYSSSGYSRKQELDTRLAYKNTFNKNHNVDLLAALTLSKNRVYNQSITIDDFPEDNYLNAFYQGITPQQPTGSSSGSALLSYIFRTNYNFKSRYLATISIRRDGTSRMSPEKRFANFPSVALGWNIAEESFMIPYRETIQMLKMRASWGKIANAAVPPYGWMTTFNATSYNNKVGIIPKQISNEDLLWETSSQYDVGIDFAMFKDSRINGSIGLYKKMTRGALSSYSLPMSAGLYTSTTMANLIDINNQGVEFDLTAKLINKKDLRWSVNFNIAHNTNKLMRMDADIKRLSTYAATILKVGQPIGLFYGYKTDGLFRSWEEVNYYQSLNPSQMYQPFHMAPGEIKLVDNNGNGWVDFGTATANYTEVEKQVLGKSFPDFYGGFSTRLSWKGLTLSIQGNYSFGAKKNWSVMETQFQFSPTNPKNLLKLNLNRWTPENPNSKYPKMLMYPANSTTGFGRAKPLTQYFHDYWLYDASYVKINNLSLSYRLSNNILERYLRFVSNFDFGFTVNNLVTFTKYPGVNPEAYDRIDRIAGPAMDNSLYPKTRTFNFTLNVTFKQNKL